MNSLRLLAPLSGPALPLESVPDPVFSQKLAGEGIAIDPTSHVLKAPCSGKIVQLHSSKHALTVQTDEGIQVLLHIGIDTVKLKGEGFTALVKVGDAVKTGDELIRFDLDLVGRKAKSLISMMVIADPKGATTRIHPVFKNVSASRDELLSVDFEGPSQKAFGENAPAAAVSDDAESAPLRLNLPTGLHARPAAIIATQAKTFSSEVQLVCRGRSAQAKSVVDILALEVGPEDEVVVKAKGFDAALAVNHLTTLLKGLREEKSASASPMSRAPAESIFEIKDGVYQGQGASMGLACGPMALFNSVLTEVSEEGVGVSEEMASFTAALEKAKTELEALQGQFQGPRIKEGEIFAAHRELLEDPMIISQTLETIREGFSAAFSFKKAMDSQIEKLSQLKNELLAARAHDLRDISNRVLKILLGSEGVSVSGFRGKIVLADTLSPSDIVELEKEKILGFCTVTGGVTSHVAILAKSMGLPAVTGLSAQILNLNEGDEVVIDGEKGTLKLHPTDAEKAEVAQLQKVLAEKRQRALSLAFEPAVTKDGIHVHVVANIGGEEDAARALEQGCDGIGLLRSEFLFTDRDEKPSETDQLQIYKNITQRLQGKPVVVRTLDVGGDKPLSYLPLPHEENPFLGVRGIRVGLQNQGILREQLRALLKPGAENLSIMFPMISTIEDFVEAKKIFEEEKTALGVERKTALGLMIEVPSAALLAEEFVLVADFFSIGTNDLAQYTLAADRGHPVLSPMVDGLHPSVLKLISMTVAAADKAGKPVAVCGGIASDPVAIPVLLGLGVKELSVSVASVALIKSRVRDLSLESCKKLSDRVLKLASSFEVRKLVQESDAQGELS